LKLKSPDPIDPQPVNDFLAELLAEQQRLDTPVARFANAHDQLARLPGASETPSALAPQLIPLSAPQPGEQYAFEVDLDSCSGCKTCVAACHALNGLDDTETWRDVGLLVGGDDRHPFQQTVTTACHHCADPACLNGCPVLAYEKDSVTGIVRHLDDQCIGCQYCVLKCPYDVPKYNARLGIVRKCDMCHGRLGAGEAPACVQACPTHAIRIVTVSTTAGAAGPGAVTSSSTDSTQPTATYSNSAETLSPTARSSKSVPSADSTSASALAGNRGIADRHAPGRSRENQNVTQCVTSQSGVATNSFLPGAPDPAYTRPTTRYVGRRGLPSGLRPADDGNLRVQPAHAPLAIMLTLLPLAIGAQGALAIGLRFVEGTAKENVTHCVTLVGWLAGAIGLAASVAHLGQPGRAWRIFLGWRRSWLSREAIVFGAWFGAASAFTALVWFAPAIGSRAPTLGNFLSAVPAVGWGAVGCAALGALGLFCSTMIYVDTRRVFWRGTQTASRIFGSAIVLGAATLLAAGVHAATWILVAALLMKIAIEIRVVRPASDAESDALVTPELSTARLLVGPLRKLFGARVVTAGIAGVLFPLMQRAGAISESMSWMILAGVLAGEFMERILFFRAVDAPKMPGMPG
jgi:Fe-S-cluster-containing dehydrogenase component/DMSO reductase anchor subunit